jgi:putative membrane protein
MLAEFIIAVSLGVLAGVIAGLLPGIHSNLLAVILLALSSILLSTYGIPIFYLVIFIVAMSIAQCFLDFIPSIYLGAPDEDTVLSVMPGHELLLEGKGHQAIILTIIGSVIGLILFAVITPIFIYFLPAIYPFFQKMMFFFLAWAVIFLIAKEEKSKILATVIFLLAGFLGIATFNLPISQPLLPLLTGLFGASSLIYSIKQQTKIPKQILGKIIFPKAELIKPIISSFISAPICSFLPGLGGSQAAILGTSIFSVFSRKQFLILLGIVNTMTMALSFIAFYTIDKARTGSAKAIQQILTESLTRTNLIYIFIAIAVAATISIFLTIYFSKLFAQNITRINYSKISLFTLLFLCVIVFLFSGFLGFLVFVVSTLVGLACIYLNIRKSHLMGAILLPTLILYFPLL